MTAAGTSWEQRTAAHLAAKAEIRDVRLLNSQCSLDSFYAGSAMSYDVESVPQIERNEKAPDSFVVRCRYTVAIEADEGDEPFSVASVQCEFGALYSLDGQETFTDAEYSAFSESIAQLALWPYVREFVQSATVRLGLPSLTLGLFRIGMTSEEAGPAALES